MSCSLNVPNTGIAPGPTRIAWPISVGVDCIRSGASRPPPIAAPAPEATWHAAQLSWYSWAPLARSPARRVDVGDVRAVAERAGVVDEGDDLLLGVAHRATRRPACPGAAIGMRPVRSTKSTAARPSSVSVGPRSSTPRAVGAVAAGALRRRTARRRARRAPRRAPPASPGAAPSDSTATTAAAATGSEHEHHAHCSSQIVENTSTQMTSTRCQNSEIAAGPRRQRLGGRGRGPTRANSSTMAPIPAVTWAPWSPVSSQ